MKTKDYASFAWTFFVILIVYLFATQYNGKTYTGITIGPLKLKEGQIVDIQAETYHIKATACSPFSFSDADGNAIKPNPEIPQNSGCPTAFFKLDSDLQVNHLTLKTGSTTITVTTETPTVVTTSYDIYTVENVWFFSIVCGFFVWLFVLGFIQSEL